MAEPWQERATHTIRNASVQKWILSVHELVHLSASRLPTPWERSKTTSIVVQECSVSSILRAFRLHGVMILTLGLLAGVTISFAARPETVLSAHVIGITCRFTAIAVGQLVPFLQLSALLLGAVQVVLPLSLYLGF